MPPARCRKESPCTRASSVSKASAVPVETGAFRQGWPSPSGETQGPRASGPGRRGGAIVTSSNYELCVRHVGGSQAPRESGISSPTCCARKRECLFSPGSLDSVWRAEHLLVEGDTGGTREGHGARGVAAVDLGACVLAVVRLRQRPGSPGEVPRSKR